MKTVNSRLVIALFACLGATLGATSGFAQSMSPLAVKTGEWQTTMTRQGGPGAAMLPPGLADKMPPAQRAQFEERMKAAMGPSTTTSKSCVSKETLAKGFSPDNTSQRSCKYRVVASTPTHQQYKMECASEVTKSTGTMTVDAVDSSNIKGLMEIVTAGRGGQPSTMSFSFLSKWTGPVCSEKE